MKTLEKVWSVLNFLYIYSSNNNALKIREADALLRVNLQDMDCTKCFIKSQEYIASSSAWKTLSSK